MCHQRLTTDIAAWRQATKQRSRNSILRKASHLRRWETVYDLIVKQDVVSTTVATASGSLLALCNRNLRTNAIATKNNKSFENINPVSTEHLLFCCFILYFRLTQLKAINSSFSDCKLVPDDDSYGVRRARDTCHLRRWTFAGMKFTIIGGRLFVPLQATAGISLF